MGLKDRIVRALALRWLRGKVKGEAMSKILKALEGWKLVIGVLILTGAAVYDHYNNGSAGSIVAAVLATVGWMPSGIDFTQAAGAIVVLIGIIGKVVKAQKQLRAGATMAETGSLVGQVKAAMVAGQITLPDAEMAKTHGPSVILVEGHPFEVPKGA